MQASQTRANILSERIAEAILSGQLAPGTHLDEQILAKRFGVSRTPVRDALRLLSGTGLIDIRPRRGATVRVIASEELDLMFIAMGEIEASCARLATSSMSAGERGNLKLLHEEMGRLAADGDREAYVSANMTFHGLLYEGAHNVVMEEIASNLRRRLTPYRRAQFDAPGRLVRSHAEHDLIVRAVLARDAAAANSAMLVHMCVVEGAFKAVDAASARKRMAAAVTWHEHDHRIMVPSEDAVADHDNGERRR